MIGRHDHERVGRQQVPVLDFLNRLAYVMIVPENAGQDSPRLRITGQRCHAGGRRWICSEP